MIFNDKEYKDAEYNVSKSNFKHCKKWKKSKW